MSRLSKREFNAMNNPLRRILQRLVEIPMLKRLSVPVEGQDLLEIGCGSGYGAKLLSRLAPRSYIGLDIMPEQIALARKRLPEFTFYVQDAAVMEGIPDDSQDTVVVFGVLHHIPEWQVVVDEMHRVLRNCGEVYLEEPDGAVIAWFDRIFNWGHPVTFRLKELEKKLVNTGFEIIHKKRTLGFGLYRLRKS